MKELMLGNKAVARGLYEAGCCVISSYPGTPSTEITEEAAKYPEIYCEWAPNEKVALEVAHGAAVGGKRTACCMKHVGLKLRTRCLLFPIKGWRLVWLSAWRMTLVCFPLRMSRTPGTMP